jgi:hypothetical protein
VDRRPERQPDYGDAGRPAEELVRPEGPREQPAPEDVPEEPPPMAPADEESTGEPLTDPSGPSG